ncbi:protein-L-isoaspartate O-methyltransferase [Lacibacterium aquatile]|uniref:Protein-L-isoaspartate O-methyltransferase n=1 Tax=Lacibacterium aquatile TaxID=1168082 RepID=A0ABW5DPL1_9PROT
MDYAAARKNMIECQVRTNKVIDPVVVDAMSEVARELFVPESLKGVAYIDEDLPVAPGRVLVEPMIAARMIQSAGVKAGEKVLEIATGTGYGAALLKAMGAEVTALDSDAAILASAKSATSAAGYDGITFVQGALTTGAADKGPFDVILITGAVESVPPSILDQLADGGRLVAVVRPAGTGIGVATLFIKAGHIASPRSLFDAATPALAEFAPKPHFSF